MSAGFRFSALVTGGFGFLGRAVAQQLRVEGYRVVGVGHGRWAEHEAQDCGFDRWLDAGVSISSLQTLREAFDLIVHCAGNGSVGYSLTNPLQDFDKTVGTTAELLEYIRLEGSEALLVYPSSAGVYGRKNDVPLSETAALDPISPYGHHKRIAEELLSSFSMSYGIRVAVIRYFSIYGPGLTKQLLWDASIKLRSAEGGQATFWGTGDETRDWISSYDAARLVVAVSRNGEQYSVFNGASGVRTTVRETLEVLREALGSNVEIAFNDVVREGDPRYYHANVERARALGWAPTTQLADGIEGYVKWLRARREHILD